MSKRLERLSFELRNPKLNKLGVKDPDDVVFIASYRTP